MWSARPRPKRSDQVITNNYLPPRGSEPPRVEISAPGEEEVKKILRRWEHFHPGASAADRLNSLYHPMNHVLVAARGMGLHSSGDTLFNYGYDCCAFTYTICGSNSQIPDIMPNPSVPLTAEFFANPCCPQAHRLPLLLWIILLLVGRTVRKIVQPRPRRRFFGWIKRGWFFQRIKRGWFFRWIKLRRFFRRIKRRRFFRRISRLSRI